MFEIVLFIGLVVVLFFGLVVLRGAPYLPTLRPATDTLFELLALAPGDTLLELGSGDGRILAAAAKRGIYAVGYELNPLLVVWTKLRYWRHRHYITVYWGDYWRATWPASDAMYVFLLDRYMSKLHTHITHYIGNKDYKVVSNTFKITEKKPQSHKNGLFLYTYNTQAR